MLQSINVAGRNRSGLGEAGLTHGLTGSRMITADITCCGCWLMESITLPTLIVIEAGACLDVGGVDLKNNINKKEFILSG